MGYDEFDVDRIVKKHQELEKEFIEGARSISISPPEKATVQTYPYLSTKIGGIKPFQRITFDGSIRSIKVNREYLHKKRKKGDIAFMYVSDDSGVRLVVAFDTKVNLLKDMKPGDKIRVWGYSKEYRNGVGVELVSAIKIEMP